MKKVLSFTAICLAFCCCCSLIGCSNNAKQNNREQNNREVIELTLENWREYLAYQETSNTSPVTQNSAFGLPYFTSEGTYTVRIYPISNAKFENVHIEVDLKISTLKYSSGEDASVPLSDRRTDDWYFVDKPYPSEDSSGFTSWTKSKSGTLSNNGEISFSESCKMLVAGFSSAHSTLEQAIMVTIREISGNVIIEK